MTKSCSGVVIARRRPDRMREDTPRVGRKHLLVMLFAVAAVIVSAGCGSHAQKRTYPPDQVAQFIAGCEDAAGRDGVAPDQAAAGCACLVKELEKRLDVADFLAFTGVYDRPGFRPSKEITDAVAACRSG